jgi:hypothetical protein
MTKNDSAKGDLQSSLKTTVHTCKKISKTDVSPEKRRSM